MSTPQAQTPPARPLSSKPQPSGDLDPNGIAADDAGATSMAEKITREAKDGEVSPREKAQFGVEASRDEDA